MMMMMMAALRLLVVSAAPMVVESAATAAAAAAGPESLSSLLRRGHASGSLRRLNDAGGDSPQPDAAVRMLADGGGGAVIKYEQCFRDNTGRNLVYFLVCPAQSGCVSRCYGGIEYVSDLDFFIAAFAQAQHLGGLGYEDADGCASASKVCNADDKDCYEIYGCKENQQGGDQQKQEQQQEQQQGEQNNNVEGEDAVTVTFDVLNYLAGCTPYGNDFFVGPYCQDHVIYLGAYADSECRWLADAQNFTDTMGHVLPYSPEDGTSLVDETCAECTSNNGDEEEWNREQELFYYYYGGHGRVQCQELFEAAQGRVDGMYNKERHHQWLDMVLLVGVVVLATSAVLALTYWGYLYLTGDLDKKDGSINEKMVSLMSGWTMGGGGGAGEKEGTTTTAAPRSLTVETTESSPGAVEEQPAYVPPAAVEDNVGAMPSCQQGFMIMMAEAFDEASTVSASFIAGKAEDSAVAAAAAAADNQEDEAPVEEEPVNENPPVVEQAPVSADAE